MSKANITVSVGVSTINFEQRSTEDPKLIGRRLLQRADKALYQAKQSGRDQVIFLDKD
ncbi:MAG: diguanylate cyclase [Pseudomonadota bacterium]